MLREVAQQRTLYSAMLSLAFRGPCLCPRLAAFDGRSFFSSALCVAATCIFATFFDTALLQNFTSTAQRLALTTHMPCSQKVLSLPSLDFQSTCGSTPTTFASAKPARDAGYFAPLSVTGGFGLQCSQRLVLVPALSHTSRSSMVTALAAAPRAMPQPASSRCFLTWLHARMLTRHRQVSDLCNSLMACLDFSAACKLMLVLTNANPTQHARCCAQLCSRGNASP